MELRLDHVFVCCAEGAPEARAMLDAGFVEGSRNAHPGQGNASRRFFFERGMIELLWVSDRAEATSEHTAPTRLWERWSRRLDGCCPFGIAFSATSDDPCALPLPIWTYRPRYLPAERPILFARELPLGEPELFFLPGLTVPDSRPAEPRAHALPMRDLLSVSVGPPQFTQLSPGAVRPQPQASSPFMQTAGFELRLRFRSPAYLHCDLRPALPLVLETT